MNGRILLVVNVLLSVGCSPYPLDDQSSDEDGGGVEERSAIEEDAGRPESSDARASAPVQAVGAGAHDSAVAFGGIVPPPLGAPRDGCLAQSEVCDGIDNDCDGAVDEDVKNTCGGCGKPAHVPGEACSVGMGVCLAHGQYACSEGNVVCDAPRRLPEREVCDGRDNDCDGATDEDVTNACGTCGQVPVEVCNGIDDDCDGTIDNGALNACGKCGSVPVEVCDGVDNDCDGVVDDGVTNACGTCGSVPLEACDGVDNDCDGAVDEGTVSPCGGACAGPEPLPGSFCWMDPECSQPGAGYVTCVHGHSICVDDFTVGLLAVCP